MSTEPEDPLPHESPTRDLLLAQALDTCIKAERQVPGSADLIIAHQPAWARPELRRLVAMASALDAAATNAVMDEGFRVAARARLMKRIGGDVGAEPPPRTVGELLSTFPSRTEQHLPRRRRSRWLWRGMAGGLLAAVLALAATLTASANALPGEPLYGVKQAREELGLRLAPDDQARARALLGQADARLDETERLLKQGRTDQVTQTTQRFDETIDRATTTLVVTIAEARTPADVQSKLSQQQEQLQAMLLTAPEPARADLREALAATERSRALVAESRRADTTGASDGSSRSTVAAHAPTPAVVMTVVVIEDDTPPPTQIVAAVAPPPQVVAHEQMRTVIRPAARTDREEVQARDEATETPLPAPERPAKPVVVARAQPQAPQATETDDTSAGAAAAREIHVPVVANHQRPVEEPPQPAVIAEQPAQRSATQPFKNAAQTTRGAQNDGPNDDNRAEAPAANNWARSKSTPVPAATPAADRRAGADRSDATTHSDNAAKPADSSRSANNERGGNEHGAGGDNGHGH